MELNSIISPQAILANLKSNSKKLLLQELAEAGSVQTGIDAQAILERLLEREHLGSTGVGNGVAIPHAKLPDIDGIIGVFAKLDRPISFEAIDDQPVDIVFMLLAPEGSGAEHLKALSRIARVLRDQNTLSGLRNASNADAIYSLLTNEENANAA